MISTYSFSRIFHVIRSQKIRVQGELTGKKAGTSPNMMRYENTVINALQVHLILAVGYRPFTVVTVVILILGLTSTPFLAEELALFLVYIKFLLNPVLYCWKLSEIEEHWRSYNRNLFFYIHVDIHMRNEILCHSVIGVNDLLSDCSVPCKTSQFANQQKYDLWQSSSGDKYRQIFTSPRESRVSVCLTLTRVRHYICIVTLWSQSWTVNLEQGRTRDINHTLAIS